MSSEIDNIIDENKQLEESHFSEAKAAAVGKIFELISPAQLDNVIEEQYLHLADLPPKPIKTSLGYLFPTEYNRLGEYYRFPASTRYFNNNGEEIDEQNGEPDAEVDLVFEKTAKEAFGHYAQMYYGSDAKINAFSWYPNEKKLAVALIIKKEIDQSISIDEVKAVDVKSIWQSINVAKIGSDSITLLTTVFVNFKGENNINFKLTSSLEKSAIDLDIRSHANLVAILGPMIEEAEGRLRLQLSEVYSHRLNNLLSEIIDVSLERSKMFL